MGGHAAGDEASRRVLFHLTRSMPGAADEAAVIARIRDAHRELFAAMAEDAGLRGMGTTLVGLLIGTAGCLHFNVGDSRLYRVRDGFIRQISTDDAPLRGRSDTGSARSGQLTQSLGGSAEETQITPHVGSEPLVPGWLYLLCSDGLTDLVELDRIEAVLTDGSSDAAKAAVLLAEALARGGTDNVSILLVRLLAAGEAAS
jgi:serine/threonine protein phosphatase PrpC